MPRISLLIPSLYPLPEVAGVIPQLAIALQWQGLLGVAHRLLRVRVDLYDESVGSGYYAAIRTAADFGCVLWLKATTASSVGTSGEAGSKQNPSAGEAR